ncbi:MAG: AMP-binding protein [Hydrogenophaga sp.]|uniref:AMP-binding protein n=1 Tax=Hydrogenophaga sp. TaxID=1904254 RepID=UPI003D123503
MNLFSLLERTARQWPDGGAVYLGDERVQTWASLRHRSLVLAGALSAFGPAGSRVAVASENAPAYLELMFGTWAAGGAVVPLNYKLHAKEMAQIVEDADAAVVFASPALAPALQAALPSPWRGRIVVTGTPGYESLFQGEPAAVAATDPQSLAWLFYTSGTTGRSKGAMLSHRSLMSMTLGHLADVETIDETCSQIHAAPMSHGSGLYIPAYVARGARQVVPASQGFDPAEFLALCDSHPGCGAFLAPTMVQRLRLAAQASGHLPAQLRTIVYGGGPMYVEELRKSLAVFGQVFVQIYGQGESPMTITWVRREDHASGDEAILGSVGVARTGVEVRVIGEDGADVPPGEIGEIIVRGDVVMAGYWNNASGTAEALRDGWLHTGDMGSLDPRGYLTLRDRSKDVVISGGSNIYPREVEEALLTHTGVAEVSVVGQADEEWGEVVVAFIVVAPGEDVTPQALDAHCLDRIARFKRPKRYLFLDALPKNSYGKVLKRQLREQLAAGGTR